MTRDKENLARAEEEVKELKEKLISLQEELQKTNTKLNIYDKAGLLKLPDKDPTLLPPRVATPSPKEFEKLREAHSELQLLYREKSRELNQLSTTITSHSSTYQALQAQVANVTQESEEKERQLNVTIRSLEDTVRRRNDRCDKLETQVLTLTNRGIVETLEDLTPCLTQTVSLGKHDNVLEFHIEKVAFELAEFAHLKTFVSWTVPFSLEDPLQHTNVARGTEARYNYSALYKFQINSRNLTSLKEDTVTVSVYILLDSGHPAKVGECRLTFQEVLDHPRNTLHGTVPVVLAHDDAEEAQHITFTADIIPGQVIGNMSYWFRLQRPSEDAIAQYLRTSGTFLTAQREKVLAKESKATKSITNSVKMRSVANEMDTKPEVQMVKGEEKDFHKEILPTSEHKHPLLSPDNRSSSTEKTEYSEKDQENIIQNIEPDSESRSENASQVQGDITGDPVPRQGTRSRSASVSSTGTYNVESPMKSKTLSNSNTEAPRNLKSMEAKRVNSEGSSEGSSTGTFNVESPKMSKVSANSNTETSKILKHKKTKRADSKSSVSHSSARSSKLEASSSSSHKKSTPSRSSSHSRKGVSSEVPEEGPTTSQPTTSQPTTSQPTTSQPSTSQMAALPLRPSPKRVSHSLSRSQPLSSEDSPDTSLEDEGNSDQSHPHTPQKVVPQKAKNITKKRSGVKEVEKREVLGNRKIGKSSTESQAQQLPVSTQDTSSSNDSRQEDSEDQDQDSSSDSNDSSDSEGVVAVVAKTTKDDSSRIYVEVTSMTLRPDCGVLQDPMVELIFIDYHGFLGLPPDQLETPVSLPKNAPNNTLNFKFGQEFSVDKKQHPARVQALAELMSGRGILKFTITSEPSEEMQDTHDCQDLGYAYVDLQHIARERQDMLNGKLPVESAEDGSQIGELNVTLQIVQALENLGLA